MTNDEFTSEAYENNLSKKKPKITELIEKISDPRVNIFGELKHPLTSVIFCALVGSLTGGDNWIDIEDNANHLKDWIAQYTDLSNGVPSHDTFGRVFGLIDSQVFSGFLVDWADHLRQSFDKEVVAFDGKTMKGSSQKRAGIKALHTLNAFSIENGICLGHLDVDRKTNEITVIPKLIEMLDLENCIITSDALNTQKSTVISVIDAKADYVLPVKGNHPELLDDIKLLFDDAEDKDYKGFDAGQFETTEIGHGRWEQRIYSQLDAEELPVCSEWKGMRTVLKITRRRTDGDRSTWEFCYFISSLDIDAPLLAHAIRGHWAVENKLHWSLDVIFREDNGKYKNRSGAQNLSAIRKIALGMLKKDTSTKKSIRRKRKAALLDKSYLERLLKTLS